MAQIYPPSNFNGTYVASQWTNSDTSTFDTEITSQIALLKQDLLGGATSEQLDSIHEIANSLNNDSNFANTINTLIDTKANDDAVVKLTGNQTIAGSKTFSNPMTLNSSLSVNQQVNIFPQGAGIERYWYFSNSNGSLGCWDTVNGGSKWTISKDGDISCNTITCSRAGDQVMVLGNTETDTLNVNATANLNNNTNIGSGSDDDLLVKATSVFQGGVSFQGSITLPSTSISDTALSSNVVLKDGVNTFTDDNTFANITATGNVVLPASSISDTALSSNVVLKDGVNTFTDDNTFANITATGTVVLPESSVSDSALSSNVVLKDGVNTFTDDNTFANITATGTVVLPASSVSDSALTSNIPRKNASNTFENPMTLNSSLSVNQQVNIFPQGAGVERYWYFSNSNGSLGCWDTVNGGSKWVINKDGDISCRNLSMSRTDNQTFLIGNAEADVMTVNSTTNLNNNCNIGTGSDDDLVVKSTSVFQGGVSFQGTLTLPDNSISDASLSSNVAFLDGNNTFSGDISIPGAFSIGENSINTSSVIPHKGLVNVFSNSNSFTQNTSFNNISVSGTVSVPNASIGSSAIIGGVVGKTVSNTFVNSANTYTNTTNTRLVRITNESKLRLYDSVEPDFIDMTNSEIQAFPGVSNTSTHTTLFTGNGVKCYDPSVLEEDRVYESYFDKTGIRVYKPAYIGGQKLIKFATDHTMASGDSGTYIDNAQITNCECSELKVAGTVRYGDLVKIGQNSQQNPYTGGNSVWSSIDMRDSNTDEPTGYIDGVARLISTNIQTADIEFDTLNDTITSEEVGYLQNVSSNIQTQLNSKANASDVSNIDNTSDLNKPISTATQSALDLKSNIDSPTFTGTPTAPNPLQTDNTTRIATTSFVKTEIANLVNGAGTTLDTLSEISSALGNDPNLSTTLTNLIGTKVSQSSYDTAIANIGTNIDTIEASISNIDNTSDLNKPISTAMQTALNLKVNTTTFNTATQYLDATSSIQTQIDAINSTDTAQQTAIDDRLSKGNGGVVAGNLSARQIVNTQEVVSAVSVSGSETLALNYANGAVFYVSPNSATAFQALITNANPNSLTHTTCTITMVIDCSTYESYASTCQIGGISRNIQFIGGIAPDLTDATTVLQNISIIYSGSSGVPVCVLSCASPFYAVA